MNEIASRVVDQLSGLKGIPNEAETDVKTVIRCLKNGDVDGVYRAATQILLTCEIAECTAFRSIYDFIVDEYVAAEQQCAQQYVANNIAALLEELARRTQASYTYLYSPIFGVSHQLSSIGVSARSELSYKLDAVESKLMQLDRVFESYKRLLESRVSEMCEILLYQKRTIDDLTAQHEANEATITELSQVIQDLQRLASQQTDRFARFRETMPAYPSPNRVTPVFPETQRIAVPLQEYVLTSFESKTSENDELIRLRLLIDEVRCILTPQYVLATQGNDDLTMSIQGDGNMISEPQNTRITPL